MLNMFVSRLTSERQAQLSTSLAANRLMREQSTCFGFRVRREI
jgi:hypothetical protein